MAAPEREQLTAETVADLIERAMAALATKRPVFHSEADFQHSLAWELHLRMPGADVRLETRLSPDSSERLDLLFEQDSFRLAVELKYPLEALVADVDSEYFELKSAGAWDIPRFAFIWDVVRLERFVAAGGADAGAAVLLSNANTLWEQRPPRAGAADTNYRLYDGRELAGRLGWTGTAMWWKGKHPEFVELTGSYLLTWRPYSTVAGKGRGEFRWTAAVVIGP
jgi:hypothetical protein